MLGFINILFFKLLAATEIFESVNTNIIDNINKIIKSLKYADLKTLIDEERKNALLSLNVISKDDDAFWLIDYWCSKNYLGLIQMPLSRHLIMHSEGCIRIYNKLKDC
jgi:hypothetical protein